jgi:hypothetical protein
MKKIRDLRLLIGAAALATAATSAGLAIVAATSVGVQADSVCEGVWVNGKTIVFNCHDIGTGAKCVNAGVAPQFGVEVCVPD